jgi:hypothetical protein
VLITGILDRRPCCDLCICVMKLVVLAFREYRKRIILVFFPNFRNVVMPLNIYKFHNYHLYLLQIAIPVDLFDYAY